VIVTEDTFSITNVFFPKLMEDETNILQGMLELADNSTDDTVAEFNFTPLIFGDMTNFTFESQWIVVDTDYDHYAIITMCN
jgi:hypothetical protein